MKCSKSKIAAELPADLRKFEMFDQDDLFLGDNCNKFDIRKNGNIGDLSNLPETVIVALHRHSDRFLHG